MSHVEEGTIVRIRDGVLVDAESRVHVESCSTCGEAMAAASRRSSAVSDALASFDRPIDVHSAKVIVRQRLDVERAGRRSRRAPSWFLGRAAALVLLSAGAVWALPGTPVRDLLRSEPVAEPEPIAGPVTPLQESSPVGIEVNVADGRIRVSLDEIAAGSEVELLWVPGTHARITAAPGSRYSYAAGHARATISGRAVRVEIPRSAEVISLEANGRMLLQRSAEGSSLPGTVVEQDAGRILFSISGR